MSDGTMRRLNQRLQKLETVLARRAVGDDGWGGMAFLRDRLLRVAEPWGESRVAEMKAQLGSLGPRGLWCEVCRTFLADHGIVQSGSESFAETIARASGIDTSDLRALLQQGRIGAALIDRFRLSG
jgi:hypothetical protein